MMMIIHHHRRRPDGGGGDNSSKNNEEEMMRIEIEIGISGQSRICAEHYRSCVFSVSEHGENYNHCNTNNNEEKGLPYLLFRSFSYS
mmetsp:Transcript_49077/g.118899  ORF Transcript_49077/g.118899 Transcript_49077/m.118899 type:complete len:87 (+) Transcript_49077:97-357(+)